MLDTTELADVLREAGVEERQARAIVHTQKRTVEESGLATKEDIVRLDERLKAVFAVLAILVALSGAVFVQIFFGGGGA